MREPGNRVAREKACREIAELVEMSFCAGADGWDSEIVRLADTVGFDKHDILRRPRRVASQITKYLDDLVRNP